MLTNQRPEGKNPVSNTGLNSQVLDDEHLTVKIDWLQLSTLHTSVEGFQQMLKRVEQTFEDQITWYADRPLFRGRRWETSGESVRGVQVCLDIPRGGQPSRGWLMIPGRVLAFASAQDIHALIVDLARDYAAIARRMDVAIDDYSKPFDFHYIYTVARAGNVAGCQAKSVAYHASATDKEGVEGESVVLGSPQSDKRVTFYNKDVESNGVTKSHRVEARLRDHKAHQVFELLSQMSPAVFKSVGARELAGIVTGAINFLDRSKDEKNLDRLDQLDWWAAFVERVGRVCKLSAKRQEHSMAKTIGWLFKAVAPSIAMLKEVMEARDFRDLVEEILDSGKARLSEAHWARINVMRIDWFDDDYFSSLEFA